MNEILELLASMSDVVSEMRSIHGDLHAPTLLDIHIIIQAAWADLNNKRKEHAATTPKEMQGMRWHRR